MTDSTQPYCNYPDCKCPIDKGEHCFRGYPENALTDSAQTPLTDPVANQTARFAIDGAMAYGYQNIEPPSAGHWLAQYWTIGRRQAEADERIAALEAGAEKRAKWNAELAAANDRLEAKVAGLRYTNKILAERSSELQSKFDAAERRAEAMHKPQPMATAPKGPPGFLGVDADCSGLEWLIDHGNADVFFNQNSGNYTVKSHWTGWIPLPDFLKAAGEGK